MARSHLCLVFSSDLRNNYRSQVLTAFNYLFCLAFEWGAWRQTRSRISAGEFDVVLRLLPISAVLPSLFAFFLRKGPIPFVIGPINGGLPWLSGFSQLKTKGVDLWPEEFLPVSAFRPVHLSQCGSHHRSFLAHMTSSAYRDKLFFIPENGIPPPFVC